MSASDVVWTSSLDADTCWRLLRRERIGRIAFVRDGRPWLVPVNHLVDEGTIAVRTDASSALGALDDGAEVVFEVDDSDPQAKTGWSVVVHGRVVPIDDPVQQQALNARGLQPWGPGPKDRQRRIVPDSVTGKAISRHRKQSDGTFLPYMPPD